jgi:hypothetical protein
MYYASGVMGLQPKRHNEMLSASIRTVIVVTVSAEEDEKGG